MSKRKQIPACAATMGCLCYAHARGASVNAACDANEPQSRAGTDQATADAIARRLGTLANVIALRGVADGHPGADMTLSRTLDGIATTAANLSVLVAHGRQSPADAAKRATKVRKAVRKALGYSYP